MYHFEGLKLYLHILGTDRPCTLARATPWPLPMAKLLLNFISVMVIIHGKVTARLHLRDGRFPRPPYGTVALTVNPYHNGPMPVTGVYPLHATLVSANTPVTRSCLNSNNNDTIRSLFQGKSSKILNGLQYTGG